MNDAKRTAIHLAVLTLGAVLAIAGVLMSHEPVHAQTLSTDATLSGLELSDVDFGTFASSTTTYAGNVASHVTETTVTPAVSHSAASYVIKLDGVEDSDGVVSLSVGSSVITVEVTAEDSLTTEAYTVTVTRAVRQDTEDLGDITSLEKTMFPRYTIDAADEVVQYFRFTLTEPKFLYIALRQLDYNADLALEDIDGNQLKEKTKSGTSSESIGQVLLEGTYYIRVDAREEGENNYVLRYGVSNPNPKKVEALRRAANHTATGAPTISGLAQVGETLTADTSGISDDDGLTNVSYSYQWIRSSTSTDEDIPNATSTSYLVSADDVGKTLKVRVSFTDDLDNEETLTSTSTATVSAAVPGGPRSVDVQLTGTGRLTVSWEAPVSDGGSDITRYTVQWKEATGSWDSSTNVFATTTTETSYTISGLSLGTEYTVRVVASNLVGDGPESEEASATADAYISQQKAPNAPATGGPTIDGTAEVGQALTVETSGITDDDGLDNVSYTYQWIRSDGTTDEDISNATSTTYTLVDADEGKTIKVTVSFSDDEGNAETLTSAATAAVRQSLTVSLTSRPVNHNGTGVFRFEMSFSEEPKTGFSRKTLRDHAFSVTGGSVKKAGRMNRPSNISWRITVKVDGAGDVTIVLPVTTDCEAAGAVCTGDGRKLSLGLSLVVPGPNSPATGAPTISGTAEVGQTLTADTSNISDDDGLNGVSFSYQWLADDTEIGNATSSAYLLTMSEMGKAIKVRVSFTDDRGNDEVLTSAATDTVSPAIQQQKAPNTPATGAPTISGTTQVGQTLTVSTSDIRDSDGLEDVSYSYQWVRNDGTTDMDISNATSTAYLLVDADEGKTIKVKVSFTDDGGNDEVLTSASTATVAAKPNSPATGTPMISGTTQVGQTLTADTSNISDDDGLNGVSFSYQWLADDAVIANATSSAYLLTTSEMGKAIKVKVSFTDDRGIDEVLTSAATASVAAKPNSVPIGAPTISGTARVGETLTADTSDISDSDGLTNATYSYQWVRNDGTDDTDISGATSSTYTLVDDEEDMTIKVRVSFIDDAGNRESLTSSPTSPVTASRMSIEYVPSSSLPQGTSNDEPGTVSHITVSITRDDSDPGNVATTFAVTWSDVEDCSSSYNAYLHARGDSGDTKTELGSAASDAVRISKELSNVRGDLTGFDVELFCGTDSSGQLVSRVSIPSDSDAEPKAGTYSSEPPLTGLSVNTGTLTPGFNSHTLRYTVPDAGSAEQITITAPAKAGYDVDFDEGTDDPWIASMVITPNPFGPPVCGDLAIAASSELDDLTDADPNTPGFQVDLYQGKNHFFISAVRTDTCDITSVYWLTIVQGNTPATGSPTISGTAQVGQSLTVGTTGIADADGLDDVSYNYQWIRNDGTTDTDISGATSSTYTLVSDDQGKTVKVKVSFTDDAGNAEELTSAATATVAARPNSAATGTPAVSGKAEVGQTLTADTSGIADADGLTRVSYSYQWLADDVEIAGATASTYLLTTNEMLKAIKVRISFTDDRRNNEILTSTATSAVSPAVQQQTSNTPATGAPTISGTAQVGQTLTADISGIADADGLTNVSCSYQWLADDTEIDGAISSTYTLQSSDSGKVIKVRVKFTDDADNQEELTSAGTEAIAIAEYEDADSNSTRAEAVELGDITDFKKTKYPAYTINGTDDRVDYYKFAITEPKFVKVGIRQLDQDASITLEDADGNVVARKSKPGKQHLMIYGTRLEGTYYIRVEADAEGENEYRLAHGVGNPNPSRVAELRKPAVMVTFESGAYSVAEGGTVAINITLNKAPKREVVVLVTTTNGTGVDDGDYSDVPEKVTFAADETEQTITFAAAQDEENEEDETVTLAFGGDLPERVNAGTTSQATVTIVQGNTPATGSPTISGTAQVGQSLTVGTTGIADADGLDDVSYNYQWIRNDGTTDTDISGATNSTYTLVSGDQGKTIKVRVGFTDDAGNAEELTSAATATVAARPNSAATGTPAVSGKAEVGQTLTADTSGIADADGLSNVSYNHQWLADDSNISGATSSTYLLTTSEMRKAIRVRVSFTDDRGNNEVLTSAATGAVSPAVQLQTSNTPATGAPTISGTAQVGETLTAATSDISDADGLDDVSYNYQWIRNDGTTDTDISGATSSTYTLVSDDQGKVIKVRVSFTDDEDNAESLTSAATGSIEGTSDSLLGSVSYITVSITQHDSSSDGVVSDFTVTWSDSEECISDYNAYLLNKLLSGHKTIHLGLTSSDGTQITKALSGVQGDATGFDVKLYCGTDASGRLVSSVAIPSGYDGEPNVGTYSSEPAITGLRVNLGTLTPAFNGNTLRYTVPDAGAAEQITITVSARTGYIVDLSEGTEEGWISSLLKTYQPGVTTCGELGFNSDSGELDDLTDADPDAPGFQVDLYQGENHVFITPVRADTCDIGSTYWLTVTSSNQRQRPNRPATGGPIISGTARVERTLTVDTSEIRDSDGLVNAEFRYRWLADDAYIADATASTYTLTSSELGKVIKVRVSFNDDRGNSERFTSKGTREVAGNTVSDNPNTGVVVVTGTRQVGETLQADVSGIKDADGLTNATFEYQWRKSHVNYPCCSSAIPGATENTYTLVDDDVGEVVWVRVRFTDDLGNRDGSESLDDEPTLPSRFAPTVEGTAEIGQTLTANTSAIGDTDGLTNATYSYQWIRINDIRDTDISGATSNTYTLVDADEGSTIRVRVSFTDDAGNSETLTSAATSAVVQPNTPATGSPTISGTAQVGQSLTVGTTGIADADGLDDVSYNYQWIRNDGTTDTDISGATNSTYTLVSGDQGKTIKVRVGFTDDAGNAEELTSAATATVAARPNSAATGTPAVSGKAEVGQTLTADTSGIADADGLSNVSYNHQWLADDSNISGATSSTYLLTTSEMRKAIRVRVSFTDDRGNNEVLTSAATGAVSPAVQLQTSNTPATGAPTISGTAQVGETLTAATSDISDADGLDDVSYNYQWIRNDGTTDTDISGATSSTYTLVDADRGKTIKVRVSFTDDEGNDEEATSSATGNVATRSWSATMTASELWRGYGYSNIGGSPTGSLTSRAFEIDDITYTVKLIEASGWFYIGFDKEVAVEFTLEVDGTRLNSGEASFESYSYAKVYYWGDAQISWSEGESVEFILYR